MISIPPQGFHCFIGSAFVINDSGQLLTNWHVLDDNPEGYRTYLLRGTGNRIEVYPVRVIRRDAVRDLAVIEAQGLKSPELVFSPIPPPKGSGVKAARFPPLTSTQQDLMRLVERLQQTGDQDIEDAKEFGNLVDVHFTSGSVSDIMPRAWGTGGHVGKAQVIDHDAEISLGSSGGPLFNEEGQVVGVNTIISVSEAGILYKACDASEVRAFLKENGIRYQVPGMATGHPGVGVLLLPAALVVMLLAWWQWRVWQQRGAVPARPPLARGERIWRFRGAGDPSEHSGFSLSESDFARRSGVLRLGREGGDADIHIAADSVGRRHALLVLARDGLCVEDSGSANGTLVNGQRLRPGRRSGPLAEGTVLEFGGVRLILDRPGRA